MAKLEIDGQRLWSDLMTMGAIGATKRGGSSRPTLSDADRDARNLFAYWAQEARMTISVDQVGNIFARREGSDLQLPPIVLGSHLDTQLPGGKFDGVLGVLAGLELARTLNRAEITTRRAIEVADWTNEEGARFPGLMGSAVFAGQLALDVALAYKDRIGLSVGDELTRIGYAGERPAAGHEIDTYLELHIEQGTVLQNAGALIGVVTNSSWWASGTIEILGSNGHAQTEPMSRRRNALVGAARLVLEIEAIGASHEPAGMVSATVIDNWPNNRINIPHRAVLQYTIVHEADEGRRKVLRQIHQAVGQVAHATGLTINHTPVIGRGRVDFSEDLLRLTESVAQQLGYAALRLPTLTGHDALNMHYVCPTVIIFVPNRDGLSHSEFEWCEPEHAAAGATVLLHAAILRANRT